MAQSVSGVCAVTRSARVSLRHLNACTYAANIAGVGSCKYNAGKTTVSAWTEASKALFRPRRGGSSLKNAPKPEMSYRRSETFRTEMKAPVLFVRWLLGTRTGTMIWVWVAAEVVAGVAAGPARGFACLNMYLFFPHPTHRIRRRVHLEQAG